MLLYRVLWQDDICIYAEIVSTGEKRNIHIKDYADFQLKYIEI